MRIVLLALVVSVLACGSEGAFDASPGESRALYESLDPSLRELFDLINEERVAAGVAPVALRADLVCAAQIHSDDVGEAQLCTHVGTDGSGIGDRVRDCGGDSVSTETVACGHLTPRRAVDGWLDSPGHRDAMLGQNRRAVGVGMHNNYWTAVWSDR